MARGRFKQAVDGEVLEIDWNGRMDVACCDCGLVHRFLLEVVEGRPVLRAWRDNRATANLRRRKRGHRCVKTDGRG